MTSTIISKEIAETLEKSEIDYMTDRMNAMKERPGNPMGIEVIPFGEAAAFYSKEMPWPQFNTVKGISGKEIDLLDAIIGFYRERNSRLQFEIIPSKANEDLMRVLCEKGFYQSDFHATLFGSPTVAFPDSEAVTIRELEEHEFDRYAEIHCLGMGLPISGKNHVADNNKVLYNRAGWKFYTGFIHGSPAGVGVMYMSSGLASLTFAATLKEHRNKGVQQALIERRINEALNNNCQFVVSQAAYASTSHRNMERAGMRLGFTRATWIQK
jgi:GNAT superfamily N-acetyltransferase